MSSSRPHTRRESALRRHPEADAQGMDRARPARVRTACTPFAIVLPPHPPPPIGHILRAGFRWRGTVMDSWRAALPLSAPPLPHPLLFSENARPENVIRARAETSSVCVVFVVVWHSGCVWCVTQAQCAILASLPGWGAVWCGAGLGGEPRGRSRTADDRGCGWERRERDSYTHDGEGVRARWFLEGLGEGHL